MNFEQIDPLFQINEENTNKYKTAGFIATKTVDEIIKKIKHNTKLLDLYLFGNEFIMKECEKVFKEIKYKGIAFPVCLSLNNIAGHHIPKENEKILEGDILKIELGVHIDGYPAFITYSMILNESGSVKNKIDDKKANVMKAVIECSKEIFKIMKPDYSNLDVAKIMKKCAKKYNCNSPIYNESGNAPGIFSFQISRNVIDGYNDDNAEFIHSFILSRNNPFYDFTQRETKFEENEVYAIDILMSTGNGKLNKSNEFNIFRRNFEEKCELKLKSSKFALGLFNKEKFPIVLNADDSKIKLGLKECLNKNLLNAYPEVSEKDGEFVARIKFTVIVKDNPILISGKSGDTELKKFE